MRKRTLMMVAALVIVGLVAGVAWAGQYGGGRGGFDRDGYGENAGLCGYGGSGPMSQAFAEDTVELRRQMTGKRGEYQALMAAQNPDPGKAAKVRQEMFEISEQLRAKAREHNLPLSPRGGGSDWSPRGKNQGHPRACWR